MSRELQNIQNIFDELHAELDRQRPKYILCGKMLLTEGSGMHKEFQKWNCDLFTPAGIGMMAYRKRLEL